MSAPQKFRSAFNGFNREDVVHYLEYLNSKHTSQVNQLTSELEYLRTRLETAQPEADQSQQIAALQQERDELLAELKALRESAPQQETPAPVAVCSASEELEAYRRAERTERMARERAELVYHQASATLREAAQQISTMTEQITPMADQILSQVNQLQAMVATGRQSLHNAEQIIQSLRPDNI